MQGAEPLSILLFNQTWFLDELRAMGHRVLSVGWTQEGFDVRLKTPGKTFSDVLEQLPSSFFPDCVVYFDDSGPVGVLGFEEMEVPSLYYSVDAHHHVSWQRFFGGLFDVVLVAQQNYLSQFQNCNKNSHWFPLWAPLDVAPEIEKTCDVSFRGNLDPKLHPQRAKFFAELKEYVDVDTKTGRYEHIFPRSKIVVNQAVKDDLNFRAFEVMMCGAMLLTPYQDNGLFELFEEGVDLVSYENGSSKDAADKIKFYLEHEQQRAAIAAKGREKILTSHSKQVRAEQLVHYLRHLEPSAKSMRHFCAGITYASASRTCRKMSEVFGNTILSYAAKNLLSSAQAGECQGSDFCVAAHVVKYDLARFGMQQEAVAFIEAVQEAYPREEVFAVSVIESLVEAGAVDRARALAQRISGKPEELIEAAPRLMSRVRAEARAKPKASA